MPVTHVLGYPRIGSGRELKVALEAFWKGKTDESELLEVGRALRARHWREQRDAGLDLVTVGDFAWYDSVLETLAHLGAIPSRFGFDPQGLTLPQYFEASRGNARQPAMELTKWFDTNYHYIVPEWTADTQFDRGVEWLFDQASEAVNQEYTVKVALVGPLTLLHLGKIKAGLSHKLDLLPRLIDGYHRLLVRLESAGVDWVQLDEPILGLDLDERWVRAFESTYEALTHTSCGVLLATYFESVETHAALLKALPVTGIHLDLVRAPNQLTAFLDEYPADSKVLSLGVIDGRNIWRADLEATIDRLKPAYEQLGDLLWISTSCSLLHVPFDLTQEKTLDTETRSWLAFARQKLTEIAILNRALILGVDAVTTELRESRAVVNSRRRSARVRSQAVRDELEAVVPRDLERRSPFEARNCAQRSRLKLPLLPTTTIGSFPQTPEVRKARSAFRSGVLSAEAYRERIEQEISRTIAQQEALGLDVLVHGEAERTDMVEYFAERFRGFALTEHGWVQSYGSRCVKPPIIYGDVERTAPMTVEWTRYARSLTAKPVKGMLTGPITMLEWSFVRDDQPREITAMQIALALRAEVHDLEEDGVAIIQIDEPALREGLPLKNCRRDEYLGWAVRAFRLASCGVKDNTQIHTHMCYADFGEILAAIVELDADVVTIEASRSDMELLDSFRAFRYPNDIGPGVYDVHSPREADTTSMFELIERAAGVIPPDRLWVNPDCGLKTRDWPETEASLRAMVEAARRMRFVLGSGVSAGSATR
jgi:5-methyltetrahydropteroyltriglutamate--homocysteine methyltransferase